jgi:DNA repair ATPase RecN
MSENKNILIGEQYYAQVSESVQSIFELTTRIDERVQTLREKQEHLEGKINDYGIAANTIATKVGILELKLATLESGMKDLGDLKSSLQKITSESERSGERWKKMTGFAYQIISAVVIAYLLFKLHLSGH